MTHEVQVYRYNMSIIPSNLIHSSVVVFGREISYNQDGISISKPNKTYTDRCEVGKTVANEHHLKAFIDKLSDQFTKEKYSVEHNNCHDFTLEIIKFLCGNPDIPDWLIDSNRLAAKYGTIGELWVNSHGSANSSSCNIA
jgi:hypothetical protein